LEAPPRPAVGGCRRPDRDAARHRLPAGGPRRFPELMVDGQPLPDAEGLRLLDPDGTFRRRLEAGGEAIAAVVAARGPAAPGRVVHRLAGAAGTFGFTEIGDAAMVLDDATVVGQPFEPAAVARLLAALTAATEKSA